ncbi:MAG TPA: hypothetical protein VN455_14775 [Methanotrichaceae archaeon]|nr:hypothetical protein [Methanotrichaceae archaeon]
MVEYTERHVDGEMQITITLSDAEIAAAMVYVGSRQRDVVNEMNLSSLVSTKLCALLELVSAVEILKAGELGTDDSNERP